jgi:hypothetical protein
MIQALVALYGHKCMRAAWERDKRLASDKKAVDNDRVKLGLAGANATIDRARLGKQCRGPSHRNTNASIVIFQLRRSLARHGCAHVSSTTASMSRTTSASSTTTTTTTTSGHARTMSVKTNTAKPQQLNPMPASDVRLFVTNLRLLDFDLRDDWPDVTVQTFSGKNADQRQRIAATEWALFRLFEIWDPNETAQVYSAGLDV